MSRALMVPLVTALLLLASGGARADDVEAPDAEDPDAEAPDAEDPDVALATRRIAALEDLEAQSVSPSAPLFAIGWRNQLMARLGAPLRPYREERGWLVRIDPAVELFNLHGEDGFPYQSWRGLLSLHVSYRTIPDPAIPLSLAVRVGAAHESDHQTAPDLVIEPFCGWAFTNALYAELRTGLDLGELQLSGALRAAWHVYSFTRVTRGTFIVDADGYAEGTLCRERDTLPAFEAAQNVEVSLDLMLRTGGPRADRNVTFCAAAHLDYLPSTSAMYEEARAIVGAGGCYRDPDVGELELMGELWLGSYVGLLRFEQFPSAAAMFRWSI